MSGNIDEISERDLLKQLESVGLSDKESRVYLALLPRRDVGSSKIINATGLHGQFVYDSLERLEQLGLAKHVIQNGRKKFSANPPLRLLSIVEEKRLAAQSIARQLQTRYSGAHEQDFEVFQGETAFLAHEFESLEKVTVGATLDVIGGAGDRYFEVLGVETKAYEDLRNKKEIQVRYIGSVEQESALKQLATERKLFTYRIFPGLSTGLVNTNIFPTFTTLNIFGDPLLSFSITNKVVADGYREFFESLWKLSK